MSKGKRRRKRPGHQIRKSMALLGTAKPAKTTMESKPKQPQQEEGHNPWWRRGPVEPYSRSKASDGRSW